ncbi:MAG: hypothetical protein WCS85_01385 [Candidatus Peribacteraceae bacterium]
MSSSNTLHAWDTGGDTLTAYKPGEVPSYYTAAVTRAIPPIHDRIDEALKSATSEQQTKEL